MIRRLALVALVASCQPAPASVIPTWSGAGPNACRDRCPEEWAVSQLTQEEQAELAAVREAQPEPSLVMIEDGTVFTLMSYYEDGAPVAYRTWTVAALSEVETSQGWVMDGWSFVKLDACDNWAIVKHGEYLPVLGGSRQASLVSPPIWTPVTFEVPRTTDPTPWVPTTPCCIVNPPIDPPPLSPVPLPASMWMLLAGLAGLAFWRKRHA